MNNGIKESEVRDCSPNARSRGSRHLTWIAFFVLDLTVSVTGVPMHVETLILLPLLPGFSSQCSAPIFNRQGWRAEMACVKHIDLSETKP
ncbi:Uncharacterized protein HZ326_21867 [Fusarium oxysporum f. sp. albedinis]|nr:Uncharacterized protein HZ326_21867 [Fusarium oxysporum f. sp. albedinis]